MFNDWSFDFLSKAFDVWSTISHRVIVVDQAIIFPSREDRNESVTRWSPTRPLSEEVRVILKAFQSEGAIIILEEYVEGRRETPCQWAIKITTPKFYELGQKLEYSMSKKAQQTAQLLKVDFSPKSSLPIYTSAKEIVDSFSASNYPFVLMVIREILSLSDFTSDGKISYVLQSPAGSLLQQERRLISKLNVMGMMSYYGGDDISGDVELGNINTTTLREVERILTENQIPQKEGKSEVHKIKELSSKGILKWRDLKIDKIKQNLQYKDGKVVEISFANNPIRLLLMILESQEVVKYTDIARELNLNSYIEESDNMDFSRPVQSVKRDLVRFLKNELNMERSEINSLIISKGKTGYRLGDE